MTPERRSAPAPLSYNGALVLQALVQGRRYGFEIMRATGLPSGTIYPLLRRLEASGLVSSSWEELQEAHEEGRPPRRYYRVAGPGRTALAEARQRLMAQQALFTGSPAPTGDSGA